MSVMSPRRLADITKPPADSISRTGRNEAINSSVKLAAATRPVLTVGGGKLKQADALDGGTMFDSTSFGTGERRDKGAAHEMSSSPRSHPLMESYERRAYESDRMKIFEDIQGDVPRLNLLDDGGISVGAQQARSKGTHAPRPDDLDDVDSLNDDDDIAPSGGVKSGVAGEQQDKHQTTAGPTNPQQLQLSPRQLQQNVDPSSASFKSPERWQASSPRTQVPAVGHYRPKHESTQYAVTHGYICSPQKMSPREKPERFHGTLPSVQTARARLEQEEQGIVSPASPTSDMDLLDSKPKKLGMPEPGKDSTVAFKSLIPQCSGNKNYSAAPDVVYWPRNDEATGFSNPPKGQIKFDRQTPRKPLATPQDVPEAYYNMNGVGKNLQCGVNMTKQTPRPPLKIAHINDTPHYDVDRSNTVTRVNGKVTDFTKCSPRKTAVINAGDVSVEHMENPLDTASTMKRVPALNMDRLKGRGEQVISHLNDLVYQSSATLTSPRERGAIIRADNTGHQSLFQPSITDNCAYNPQINPVRPKSIRNVDFDKDLARKPQVAKMHDLVYNSSDGAISARTLGDPMMSSHVDRDKREKILSPRRVHTEATSAQIDLNYVRPTKNGAAIDFSKQITKETQFAGRGMPSDRYARNNPTAPPPGSYDWAK